MPTTEQPAQPSPLAAEAAKPVFRVPAMGGRKRPQLSVDFAPVCGASICGKGSPSASSPKEARISDAPLGEAAASEPAGAPGSQQPRFRSLRITTTPSSTVSSSNRPSPTFDFQPFECPVAPTLLVVSPAASPRQPRGGGAVGSSAVPVAGVQKQRLRPLNLSTPSSRRSSPTVDFKPFGRAGPVTLPEASPSPAAGAASQTGGHGPRQVSFNLGLLTPQSCSCSSPYKLVLTPGTPDPNRGDLKLLMGGVSVIFFDFDGTLTATPGNLAMRQCRKSVELCDRAALLRPRLKALRDGGMLLGIMSKSTDFTIRSALQAAGLADFFQGPIVAKAVGLEGKAGFIGELAAAGGLGQLGDSEEDLRRVLLVDDDVRELDRARERGVQTFPAPAEGGLQDEDFDDMFALLGLYMPETPRKLEPSTPVRSAQHAQPSAPAIVTCGASPSHGGA